MSDQTEIIPGLWMGGQTDTNLQTDFDAVVDCRQEEDMYKDGAVRFVGPPNTVLLWCPMIDGPVLPDEWKLQAINNFVAQCQVPVNNVLNKVLVHCTMGMNRSGLIVGMRLITGRGMQSEQAIALIRQKRPGALSNPTFVGYLLSLKA